MEWLAVLLIAAVILGMTVVSMTLLGVAGAWIGGALGLAGSIVAVWHWFRWEARR